MLGGVCLDAGGPGGVATDDPIDVVERGTVAGPGELCVPLGPTRAPDRAAPQGAAAGEVFIDGRFLTQSLSGVQRYAQEIVRALDALAGEGALACRFTLLVPAGARKLGLRNITTRTLGTRTGHLWTQRDFARAARGGVVLALAGSAPLLHPRVLMVLHDAAVFRHPEFYTRAYGLFHRLLDRLLARRARIATVSQFSQGELAEVLGLDASAIAVAPNGAEHLAHGADKTVIDRLGLAGTRYFVTLGSFTRNKNLAVTHRAMARLPDAHIRLVMIGAGNSRVFGDQSAPAMDARIIRPGHLSDAEVAGLLRGATALVFPSIYEGFGIPPLEAMINGCPVLASTAGAVREVCGDAAAYFEPHDDAALAQFMRALLSDDGARRADVVARGQMRIARYSWRQSAQTLAAACASMATAKGMHHG